LASDEAVIISGLLVGLNSFDVTIDLKSDLHDFDSPVILALLKKIMKEIKFIIFFFKYKKLKTLNYNLYLRERIPGFDDNKEEET
jgi:hypothetical protein